MKGPVRRHFMKQVFAALRYATGATAVGLALALVCFAQAASGAQSQEANKEMTKPDIRSFAEQMMHLASANFAYATFASGRQAPYKREDLTAENYKTKAQLTKIVLESYDFMIDSIKGMDATKLNEKVPMRGTSLT